MNNLPLTAKIIVIATILGVMGMIALRLNTEYSRSKNAELKICLGTIEIGDSKSEVIQKMKQYRDKPDWVMENETIYYNQEEREGFTLLVYDPLFGDSGHLWFYFPPDSDSLTHIRRD